ncbi:hypothetical protein BaRGS_00018963, partial [Batillaria attramentaria]
SGVQDLDSIQKLSIVLESLEQLDNDPPPTPPPCHTPPEGHIGYGPKVRVAVMSLSGEPTHLSTAGNCRCAWPVKVEVSALPALFLPGGYRYASFDSIVMRLGRGGGCLLAHAMLY